MNDNINYDNEAKISMENTQIDKLIYYIVNLPIELIHTIFWYLTPEDIANIWKFCKNLRYLFNYKYFWMKLCKIHDFFEVEESSRWPAYTNYLEKFPFYWHGIFNFNRLVQHCWRAKIFKPITNKDIIDYFAIDYFDNEVFIVTGDELNLKIYSSLTGKLIEDNLFTEERCIPIVRRYQNLIVFWGRGYLRVWNMENKTWLCRIEDTANLNDRYSVLDSCEVFQTLVAIRSAVNYRLYIFDVNTKEIIFRHEDVISVCFGTDTIVFGNDYGVVQFLDFDCNPLMQLNYNENVRIKQIKIIKDRLLCVTTSNNNFVGACVWSTKKKIKLHEIKNVCPNSWVQENINVNNFIFCDSLTNPHNCTIIVWNFLKGNHLLKFRTFMIPTHFISNSRYIITHSKEHSIAKMWCIKTGKLFETFQVAHYTAYRAKSINITETNLSYINLNGDFVIKNYAPFFDLYALRSTSIFL